MPEFNAVASFKVGLSLGKGGAKAQITYTELPEDDKHLPRIVIVSDGENFFGCSLGRDWKYHRMSSDGREVQGTLESIANGAQMYPSLDEALLSGGSAVIYRLDDELTEAPTM